MEGTPHTGMRYALTVSITAVIILLAAIAYLLLRLAHGQVNCEFKGSFNDPIAVDQTTADDDQTPLEEYPPEHKTLPRKAPSTSTSGITVPGPATPTVGSPAVTH